MANFYDSVFTPWDSKQDFTVLYFLIAYFLATCSGIVKGLNDFLRKKAFALAQWRK
jgi:hypothetical protein